MSTEKRSNAMIGKVIRGLVYFFAMPLILFACAGTVEWWQGWLFLVTGYAASIVSRGIVIRKHPDLAQERVNYETVENVKDWDKKLMPWVAIYLPAVIYIVAGLDKRFGWSAPVPDMVNWLAWLVMLAGYAFSIWAMAENRFFSAVVRIQTERGHAVCSSGPYAFVRHPGYASGMLVMLTYPFILGTLWALIPVGVSAALLLVRTKLEDQTLQAELPGYAEYAQRVRYRLIPKIW